MLTILFQRDGERAQAAGAHPLPARHRMPQQCDAASATPAPCACLHIVSPARSPDWLPDCPPARRPSTTQPLPTCLPSAGDIGLEIAPGNEVEDLKLIEDVGNIWNAVPVAREWTPLDPRFGCGWLCGGLAGHGGWENVGAVRMYKGQE